MTIDLLLLSVIQGVSEILPISSSVNLHFFSSLFHISDFSFSLKVALHAGSLLTLIVYFRKEIADIFRGLFSKRVRISDTHFFPLVCGTIPVVIFGFLARDFVKEFDSPKIMGICSILFGLLLLTFDKMAGQKSRTDKTPVSIVKAFIIGCFQTIAIFPGVSRLGICLTASRMLGLDRKKAIRFSLFLAIPSICGSLTLELLDCYKNNTFRAFANDSLIGILLTTIVGLIAIWPCIKYMERNGFMALTVYRILIGIAIFFI